VFHERKSELRGEMLLFGSKRCFLKPAKLEDRRKCSISMYNNHIYADPNYAWDAYIAT